MVSRRLGKSRAAQPGSLWGETDCHSDQPLAHFSHRKTPSLIFVSNYVRWICGTLMTIECFGTWRMFKIKLITITYSLHCAYIHTKYFLLSNAFILLHVFWRLFLLLATLGRDLSSYDNRIFPQFIFEARVKSYFSIF